MVLLCLVSFADTKRCYLGYTKTDGFVSVVPFRLGEPSGYSVLAVSGSTDFSWPMGGRSDMPKSRFEVPGFRVHKHKECLDYRDAVFCREGYVSEFDITELENTLQAFTKKSLDGMLALMNNRSYSYEVFCKRYRWVLSDVIEKKLLSMEVKNEFTDLGGWKVFKPVEGVDKEAVFYKVRQVDGDWYEIAAPQSMETAPVLVKVAYAGKYLNPVIVGVKNTKMGVDIVDTTHKTYYSKKLLGFTPYDDVNNLYEFMNFICPVISEWAGRDNFLTKEDFEKLTKEVRVKEKAFVQEFYDGLRSSGNDMKKFLKKYRYRMARYFAETADKQIHKKNHNIDLFLPCSYSEFVTKGYEVEDMGEDCFKVTAGGNSLYLKVVLYGNKLTPAIMGMINSSQDIDYCPDRFPWSKSVKE